MTMASTLTETETDGAKAKEAGDSTQQPRFAVCVTTMNRVDRLTACLDQLARCDPPPSLVVVSDDSPDPSVRANEAAVAAHPGVVYLAGPRRGVCANRNNAINHCLAQTSRCDYLSFLDDAILIDADFFAAARKHYEPRPRSDGI